MTTEQIVILTIFGVLASAVYISFIFLKTDNDKHFAMSSLFILFGLLMIVAFVAILEMNKLKSSIDKCPEYEKIENVYQLKNN